MMNPGVAFPDYIKTEKIPTRRYRGMGSDDGFSLHTIRSIVCLLLLGGSFALLIGKLFHVQIVQGSYYRSLSDSNRIRTSIVHAPRGVVFDRNNTPLVYNLPGFRKTVNGKTALLNREKALNLMARGDTTVEIDQLRQYPFKDALAHVIGYIGQVSEEELKQEQFAAYRPGDFVGKMGLEQEYEEKLRGIAGKKLVEINNVGETIRTLGQTDPVPGQNITVTLDLKLSLIAYQALHDTKKGVVIATTPQGEVLALVSKPSFDPNLFTLDDMYTPATDSAYQTVSDILSDSNNQPLLNRTVSGVYPPGSTFKLITAAAGLENNRIDQQFTVEDTGVLQVGAFSFANWYFTQYGKTEGSVNVVKAIKRSNDIFFYKLAELVGVGKLSVMAKKFGLGEKTGIDLPGEQTGVVPDPSWKKQVIGENWYLGDTYHYGIGQGFLLITPLQVNVWTQAIANGGTIYRPHLLKNSEFSSAAQNRTPKFLSEKTVSLIREGMTESCQPTGVAWPLFEFRISAKGGSASGRKNIKEIDNKNFFPIYESSASAKLTDIHVVVACKTGTAQHGGEKTLPHAWITLFAPAYDPQIVITVLAESSGEGSNIAAPIAKKILGEWFSR